MKYLRSFKFLHKKGLDRLVIKVIVLPIPVGPTIAKHDITVWSFVLDWSRVLECSSIYTISGCPVLSIELYAFSRYMAATMETPSFQIKKEIQCTKCTELFSIIEDFKDHLLRAHNIRVTIKTQKLSPLQQARELHQIELPQRKGRKMEFLKRCMQRRQLRQQLKDFKTEERMNIKRYGPGYLPRREEKLTIKAYLHLLDMEIVERHFEFNNGFLANGFDKQYMNYVQQHTFIV